jgi:hypothetical protein
VAYNFPEPVAKGMPTSKDWNRLQRYLPAQMYREKDKAVCLDLCCSLNSGVADDLLSYRVDLGPWWRPVGHDNWLLARPAARLALSVQRPLRMALHVSAKLRQNRNR